MPLQIDVPGKVIAVGLNYESHCNEANVPIPATPTVFAHWPSALIGPGDPIMLPDPSIDDVIDYEGELAVIIGEQCKGISVPEALEVVRGYAAFNDVSARSLQRGDSAQQMTMGKCVDTFDPVGAMTPRSGVPDPQALRLRTIVNGEVVQDSSTAEMLFTVAEVIAYVSRTVTLAPGDLLVTGTPGGVGVLRKPRLLLRDGDEVTIDIEGLEPLSNPVRAG